LVPKPGKKGSEEKFPWRLAFSCQVICLPRWEISSNLVAWKFAKKTWEWGGFTVGSCFYLFQNVNFGFLSTEIHMSFYTSMFQVSVFLSWKQEIHVGFSYIFKGVDVAWATVDAEVYSQPPNLLPPLVGPSPLTLLSHHPNITPPSLHIGKGVLASNLANFSRKRGILP